MPSRQSVPRIRVDLLDGSSRSLSPSSTLDIKDILSSVNVWPNLLAEDFELDDAEDPLCLEDGRLQDVPSFPVGRKPPLFFLHSHRARLPFPIRQEAFEMGYFCRDEEDACPLLTAPTIPRMQLMIKEQLYVQKWVDTLTPDNPPKHIPWSCEKPATERKWVAEGSIFPADMVKPEQRAAMQELSCVVDTNRFSAHANYVPHSGELCALSEASSPIHASTESPTSTSHVSVKSADVDSGILRAESKISHIPYSIVRTLRASPPPALLPSGLLVGTTLGTPDAPLAARRGKSLGSLKLKASVIEQLEYPDIPTAFRGSPSVWSPRFDAFPVPSFTDHQSMLLDLKSKCAALGSGVSTYVPEYLYLQPEMTRTLDEWMFTRGLATFDNVSGSVDGEVPKEGTANTSISLPDDTSTPTKGPGFTAHFGFVPRPHSTPALQSSIRRSSDPPGVPLPPRPALINPSTPPHVRGILKKVKSVRFDDMVTKEARESPPVVFPPQPSPERPSSQHLAVSSRRPCTPMPNTAKLSSPIKEMPTLGRNAEEKKPAPKSRLPPKRTKANGKLEPIQPNIGNPPTVTTSIKRPCRIAHAKKNTISTTVHQAQAKQKGLSVAEADVRRGIEGTTKSRLSTPLRHIFRFK